MDVLFGTFWRLPFIYVAMFLARAASIAFFKPLFDCAGTGVVAYIRARPECKSCRIEARRLP